MVLAKKPRPQKPGPQKSILRTTLSSLPVILSAALALRLGFAWNYAAHSPHRALSVIPFLFESGNIAHSLATGGGFSSPFRIPTGPTAWMTPLYPLFLSAIMRIFGAYTFASWLAAVLCNISFSTVACLPIYAAGRRIGGAPLGALAAWLWAIFPNAILLSYQSLWDTSLSALLGATVLWATLRLPDTRRSIAWAAYGFLWGVVLMTNAALLSLLPFLLGWLAFSNRNRLPHLKRPALAAGVALLCCVPWTIRNYAIFHTFVPLRSVLGLQLWVGNNPRAKVVWLGEQHPINDTAERNRYVTLGETAYMHEKLNSALDYILHHPGHEAGLIEGRFVSIWAGGTPAPLTDFLRNSSLWFRFVLLFNLAAAIGTAIAIVLLFRARHPYAFPLAVFPLVFPWAYYVTLALPRYRHPIDPVLLLLLAVTVRRFVTGKTPMAIP